jgi:hypothetical protein
MAYGYNLNVAQIGQIADASNRIVDSFTAEAAIGFGVPVKRGTEADKEVLTWAGTIATPMLGVSVFTHTQTSGDYPINTVVSVLTSGRVYVRVVDTALTIVAGESAYVNVVTGSFTNVALNNLPIGKFLSSGSSTPLDALFVIELDPSRI